MKKTNKLTITLLVLAIFLSYNLITITLSASAEQNDTSGLMGNTYEEPALTLSQDADDMNNPYGTTPFLLKGGEEMMGYQWQMYTVDEDRPGNDVEHDYYIIGGDYKAKFDPGKDGEFNLVDDEFATTKFTDNYDKWYSISRDKHGYTWDDWNEPNEMYRYQALSGDFDGNGQDEYVTIEHGGSQDKGEYKFNIWAYDSNFKNTGAVQTATYSIPTDHRYEFLALDADGDGVDELLQFAIIGKESFYFYLFDWSGENGFTSWDSRTGITLLEMDFGTVKSGSDIEGDRTGNPFRLSSDDLYDTLKTCDGAISSSKCRSVTRPPTIDKTDYDTSILKKHAVYNPQSMFEIFMDAGDLNGDGKEEFTLDIFPKTDKHLDEPKYYSANSNNPSFNAIFEINTTKKQIQNLYRRVGGGVGRAIFADFTGDRVDDIYYPSPSTSYAYKQTAPQIFTFKQGASSPSGGMGIAPIGPVLKGDLPQFGWIAGAADLDMDGKMEAIGFIDDEMERREYVYIPYSELTLTERNALPAYSNSGILRMVDYELHVDKDVESAHHDYRKLADVEQKDNKKPVVEATVGLFGTGGNVKHENTWSNTEMYEQNMQYRVRFGDIDKDGYKEAIVPSLIGISIIDFPFVEDCSARDGLPYPQNEMTPCSVALTATQKYQYKLHAFEKVVKNAGEKNDYSDSDMVNGWTNDFTRETYTYNEPVVADFTGDAIKVLYKQNSRKKVARVSPMFILAAPPYVNGYQATTNAGTELGTSTGSGTGSADSWGWSIGATVTVGFEVADPITSTGGGSSLSASFDASFSTERSTSRSMTSSASYSSGGEKHKILYLALEYYKYTYIIVSHPDSKVKLGEDTMDIEVPIGQALRGIELQDFHAKYPKFGFDTILGHGNDDSYAKLGDPTKYISSDQLPDVDGLNDKLMYKTTPMNIHAGSGGETQGQSLEVSKERSTTRSQQFDVGIAKTSKVMTGGFYLEAEVRAGLSIGGSATVSISSGMAYSAAVGPLNEASYLDTLDYKWGLFVHEFFTPVSNDGSQGHRVIIVDYYVDYDSSEWQLPSNAGDVVAPAAGAVGTGAAAAGKKKECACK